LSRAIEPIREESCGATEQKLFAYFEQLIIPECVLVEDVGGIKLGGDSTSKVLYRLPMIVSQDLLLVFVKIEYPVKPPSMEE
jgi:hypothetical protein